MSLRRRIKDEIFYGYSQLGPETHKSTDKYARIAVRLSGRVADKLTAHQQKSHEFTAGKISDAKSRIKGVAMRFISPISATVVGPPKKSKSKPKRR